MKKDLSRIVETTGETETNLQGCLLISEEVFGATNEDVLSGVKLAKWRTARRSSRDGLYSMASLRTQPRETGFCEGRLFA
jgi:hypothetical protein